MRFNYTHKMAPTLRTELWILLIGFIQQWTVSGKFNPIVEQFQLVKLTLYNLIPL